MSINETIQTDVKTAMKKRDKTRVAALRMLGAALKNGEIEAGRPLEEQEEQTILRRQLKQREESAEAFRKAGREEQAGKESDEAEIVRHYLPQPLSPWRRPSPRRARPACATWARSWVRPCNSPKAAPKGGNCRRS